MEDSFLFLEQNYGATILKFQQCNAIYFNLSMQQFRRSSLEDLDKVYELHKLGPLKIDVVKPFQHKQIDTRWIQLKLGGKFTSRSYFASCIQAGKVYIHGGYNEEKGIINDFVSAQFYDLPTQWKQIKVSSPKNKNPPGLRNHTLCPYTSNLILFGGQKNMLQNSNTFYRFDLRAGQWDILKPVFLNDKKLHLSLDSHTAQIYNNMMYIFGGYESEKGGYSDKLYQVDLKNINQNQISIQEVELKSNLKPSPRGNFSACIVENELYIFGGTDSDNIFDDMWCYSFEKKEWHQIKKPQKSEGKDWPQRRKGHVMVSHAFTRTIFMFGGIRQITKQQNDIMVYVVSKSKWIRIHKSTNQLYEPSPTIKKLEQTSPSIIDAKNRRSSKKSSQNQPFRLGMKSVTVYTGKSITQIHQPTSAMRNSVNQPTSAMRRPAKSQYGGFSSQNKMQLVSKKQISVVQQKKIRDFMRKKNKLLSQVTKLQSEEQRKKRPHSPTSQSLLYSLGSIGEQKRYPDNFQNELPKVIFDEQKGALTGKKPCARDGHTGLAYDDSIIIIGGDRHMISFSDVYLFKMDKAINSIHLYE